MTDTLTLRLKSPIEFEGRTYENIDLSEPTAGQMEKAAVGATGVASNIILIAEVAKIPRDVVRMFKKRDLEACVEFLAGFQTDAPPTRGAS